MIKRLLIANRGEIAVRIIRTCREMGIETVAVYSIPDKECMHVRMADKAVCIGPAASEKSYLNINALITAAVKSNCEAIHPGVGFLSESAEFARKVQKAGLIWIGPDPEAIELLGDKIRARETALKYGLPVTPGSNGAVKSKKDAVKVAAECGYPVIIKAASGGGGKGMRIVFREEDLEENCRIASSEAEKNFGDKTIYIEKYMTNPRHVELQVLADGKGNVQILGERDCSLQKNHQKLVEESPSPAVTDDMRKKMYQGAQNLFSGLKYKGAGTIEFLVEENSFYFMEVNARIQVEHTVSEMISGVDIVRRQILACCGGNCDMSPVSLQGCAIEARINALTPGKITELFVPGGFGVRFDSFLYRDYTVVPFYDSMVAKLIVHDINRECALKKLKRALDELVIEGIKTNIEEQKKLIQNQKFVSGKFGTSLYAEITQGEKQ